MPYLVSCVINMVWTRMKRTRNPNPYIRSQLPDLFLFIVDCLLPVGDSVKATGACCLPPVGVTWPRWLSGRWLPGRGWADFCIRCYNSRFSSSCCCFAESVPTVSSTGFLADRFLFCFNNLFAAPQTTFIGRSERSLLLLSLSTTLSLSRALSPPSFDSPAFAIYMRGKAHAIFKSNSGMA